MSFASLLRVALCAVCCTVVEGVTKDLAPSPVDSGPFDVAGLNGTELPHESNGHERARDIPFVKEDYPDNMNVMHVVAITLSVAGTAIAVAYVGVRLICADPPSVSLPAVLVLVTWSALIVVGIVTWYITYNTTRDVILEKTEQLLRSAAEVVVYDVQRELDVGAELVLLIQYLTAKGGFNVTGYPQTHSALEWALNTYTTASESIELVYVGLANGKLEGYSSGELGYYTSILPGDDVPAVLAECPMWVGDVDRGFCESLGISNASSAGIIRARCDTLPADQMYRCGHSCKYVPEDKREYCMSGSETRLFQFELATNGTHGNATTMVMHEPLDTTKRSWYFPAHGDVPSDPLWTPYDFHLGHMGMTVSVGMWGPDAKYVGTAAVDYSFKGLSPYLLRMLRPTPNAVCSVATPDWYFIAANLQASALEEDTNPLGGERDLNMLTWPNTSVIKHSFIAIDGAVGSLQNALGGSMLLQTDLKGEAYVVVSYPVEVKGTPATFLLVSIALPYSDLMGQSDSASVVALLFAVLISVVCGSVVYAGVYSTLLPLSQLVTNMQYVSVMALDADEIEEEGGTLGEDENKSDIYEVASMQESFRKMVADLREYRQYLPQSVLMQGVEEKESQEGSPTDSQPASQMASPVHLLSRQAQGMSNQEFESGRRRGRDCQSVKSEATPSTSSGSSDEEEPQVNAQSTLRRHRKKQHPKQLRVEVNGDGASSNSSDDEHDAHPPVHAVLNINNLQTDTQNNNVPTLGVSITSPSSRRSRLSPKKNVSFSTELMLTRVSLLMTNIRSFHVLSRTMGRSGLITLHSRYLSDIAAVLGRHRGVVHDFQGDRVSASFNAVRSCPGHKTRAIECALQISAATSVIPILTPAAEKEQASPSSASDPSSSGVAPTRGTLDANQAVYSGRALCGNVGSSVERLYDIIGEVGSTVRKMERVGCRWGIPVLTDRSVAAALDPARYCLRAVVSCTLRRSTESTMLFSVVGSRVPDEGVLPPWASANPGIEQGNVYADYNGAVQAMSVGDYNVSAAILRMVTINDPLAVALRGWVAYCQMGFGQGNPPPLFPLYWLPGPYEIYGRSSSGVGGAGGGGPTGGPQRRTASSSGDEDLDFDPDVFSDCGMEVPYEDEPVASFCSESSLPPINPFRRPGTRVTASPALHGDIPDSSDESASQPSTESEDYLR